MTCQYCPAGMQGTVLGIAVDFEHLALSAPPVSWVLTEQMSPIGRSQSAPTALVGERAVSRGLVYFQSEKRVRVRSERRSLLG